MTVCEPNGSTLEAYSRATICLISRTPCRAHTRMPSCYEAGRYSWLVAIHSYRWLSDPYAVTLSAKKFRYHFL